MAVTVLKASFSKAPPKEMLHRDYKNFEQDKFKHELKNIIQNESVECYCEFEKVLWIYYINEHTPLKEVPKGYLCSLYD